MATVLDARKEANSTRADHHEDCGHSVDYRPVIVPGINEPAAFCLSCQIVIWLPSDDELFDL